MNLLQQARQLEVLDNTIFLDLKEAFSELKFRLQPHHADDRTKELISTIDLKIQSMEILNHNRRQFNNSLEAQAQSNLADWENLKNIS